MQSETLIIDKLPEKAVNIMYYPIPEPVQPEPQPAAIGMTLDPRHASRVLQALKLYRDALCVFRSREAGVPGCGSMATDSLIEQLEEAFETMGTKPGEYPMPFEGHDLLTDLLASAPTADDTEAPEMETDRSF